MYIETDRAIEIIEEEIQLSSEIKYKLYDNSFNYTDLMLNGELSEYETEKATSKQLNYMKKLVYHDTDSLTKADASRIINIIKESIGEE